MKRFTSALTALLLTLACSPTSPGDLSRDRAIEVARQHVSFTPTRIDAQAGTAQGQPVWIVTFRENDNSHGGLGQFMAVTLHRATGKLVTIARS